MSGSARPSLRALGQRAPGRRAFDGRRRGPARASTALLAAVLLTAALGVPGAAAFDVGPGPVGRSVVPDAPSLRLAVSPLTGEAPLFVNVTVTVVGGSAPFNLSLCFGTVDHTSPPPGCGAGAATGWNGSNALVFPHLYDAPGNFSIVGVVEDRLGAGSGATALVVVTSGTTLALAAQALTTSGVAPAPIRFNETVVGGTPPITIQWRFGDGTSGSGIAGSPVVHVYESAGTFVPSVTVSDAAGHRTTEILPAIVIRAASSGPLGNSTDVVSTVVPLLAVLGVTAIMIAVVVRTRRLHNLREEGEDLVDSLWQERPSSEAPPSGEGARGGPR